jgi:hypothetical protein
VKIVRSTGLFAERPYFTDDEIEQTATRELLDAGLLPTSPAAIRIERFVEKRFNIGAVRYEALPDGVLGFTQFGTNGVEAIVVSTVLSEEESRVAERRINSTIAHEGGHALLHAHLFFLDSFPRSLFDDERDVSPTKVLCRDLPRASEANRYNGCWWEYQANRMMGALLLPRALTIACVRRLTVERGVLGRTVLPHKSRRRAALLLADTFDVNPRLAELRVETLYPSREQQLAL